MGIRDALRSIRGGDRQAAADDGGEADAPEPTWFQPRYDGSYDVDGTGPGPGTLRLRFLPGGRVFESGGADADPEAERQNPCRGEFTGAGRFNVQRQFERIVSYAVLEMEAGTGEGHPGFLARRIDSADRGMSELHFLFHPDNG